MVINKNKLLDNFILFLYAFYIIVTILNSSFYAVYLGNSHFYINIITLIGMILREITKKIDLSNLIFIIFSVTLILLVYHISGVITWEIVTIMFIYSLRDINFSKIAKLTLIISSLLFIFIVGSSQLGFIENYLEYNIERTREYIGFRYSLFPSNYLLNITAIYCFLYKNKFNLIKLVIIIIPNYYVFSKTDSRLAFYSSILIIIFTYFKKILTLIIKNKIISYVSIFIFIISFSLSLFVGSFYNANSEWMSYLNSLFGGRLFLANSLLREIGINLFGSNIELIGNGLDMSGNRSVGVYNYVDNYYIKLLLQYGSMYILLIVSAYTLTIKKLISQHEEFLVFILITIALHGIIDDLQGNLHYNTFMLLIANAFYRKYKI